jgi:hypothetical protein
MAEIAPTRSSLKLSHLATSTTLWVMIILGISYSPSQRHRIYCATVTFIAQHLDVTGKPHRCLEDAGRSSSGDTSSLEGSTQPRRSLGMEARLGTSPATARIATQLHGSERMSGEDRTNKIWDPTRPDPTRLQPCTGDIPARLEAKVAITPFDSTAHSLRHTSRRLDHVSSIAQTLLSTRPIGRATSLTTCCVMSVASPDAFFGHAIHSPPLGEIDWPRISKRRSSNCTLVKNANTTSADFGRR